MAIIVKTGQETMAQGETSASINFASAENDDGVAFPPDFTKIRVILIPKDPFVTNIRVGATTPTSCAITFDDPGVYGGAIDFLAVGRK